MRIGGLGTVSMMEAVFGDLGSKPEPLRLLSMDNKPIALSGSACILSMVSTNAGTQVFVAFVSSHGRSDITATYEVKESIEEIEALLLDRQKKAMSVALERAKKEIAEEQEMLVSRAGRVEKRIGRLAARRQEMSGMMHQLGGDDDMLDPIDADQPHMKAASDVTAALEKALGDLRRPTW